MSIYIDLQKAMELVDGAVARKGEDYVYPNWTSSCSYVDYTITYDEDGNEVRNRLEWGCIIGHAFLPELPELDLETFTYNGVNEESVYSLLKWLELKGYIEGYSSSAEDYLSCIQDKQDSGAQWGVANREAKEELDY